MEKPKAVLPEADTDPKMTTEESSTVDDKAKQEGTHQDKDSDRDTSGQDHKEGESSTDKTASSEGSQEVAENQEGNTESEDASAQKPTGDGAGDNETEKVEKDQDKAEESELNIDWSKEPALDDAGRNKMFEEGLKLDKEGKKLEALKCYLRCLVGLKENSRFALLPQCLRNIGDIYYGRDEFDKAISFIQAEKLYYESVLIDDTELQTRIDEVTKQGAAGGGDTDLDALRATEYEQLAKLCLEEKQPQLALEYAGKCTKLRQKVFGDNHPLVQQSLDFFATVYAEVGKVKYTESMSKYKEAGEPDVNSPTVAWETTPGDSPSEPTSILRRRKTTEGEKEKRVRFDESQVPSEVTKAQEERCAEIVLICFFFVLLIVVIILGVYLMCNYQSPATCRNIQHMFSDATMQVKYWYYRHWSDEDSKYT